MAQNKRKKLSLEEARALFVPQSPSTTEFQKKGSRSSENPRGTPVPRASVSKDQIQKQLERLEQRFLDENLSAEEEQKVLREIERLERQLKTS